MILYGLFNCETILKHFVTSEINEETFYDTIHS